MKTPLTEAASGMSGDPHWVVAERLFVCSRKLEAQNLSLVAEYERVSAENTRLREALQPLADLRPTKVGNIPDCEHWLWKPSESGRHDLPGINVAHVKAARAALAVTLSC